MPSELKVNKLSPYTGTTLTLGDSGDTISFASGVLPSLESLTITGDLTVDTNTLFVDSTNNNVGIGTTTPSTGYGGTISNVKLALRNDGSGGNNGTSTLLMGGDNNHYSYLSSEHTGGGATYLAFGTAAGASNPVERMRIDSSGNVGIGTSSPDQIFHISSTSGVNPIIQRTSDVGNNSTLISLNFKNSDSTVSSITNLNKSGSTKNSNADGYELRISNNGDGYTSFFNDGSERMRIDSSGNVGIGTTSPSAAIDFGTSRVDTNGYDTGAIRLYDNDAGAIYGLGISPNQFNFRTGNRFVWFQDTTELMRITEGRLGIGTSNPAQKLDVNGQMRMSGVGIEYTGITSGTTNKIAFRWSSPNLSGAIDNVAFFVVGTNSDYRLKKNVENLSSVLDKINLLRPITFNAVPLQEGDVVNDVNHIGFIAHEVAEHFPSLVEGEKDAVNDEGNNFYQGLNYAGFTPILTKAIQELKADNDALRSTVADLTARLETLENT